MKIEDLNKSDIAKMENRDLHILRNQFSQVYSKFWEEDSWPGVSKDVFITKYAYLTHEMNRRDILKHSLGVDVTLFSEKCLQIAKGIQPDPPEGKMEILKMIAVSKDEDDPERIVYGIVAEPDEEDTEDDWQTEDDIREALYYFMEHGAIAKINHSGSAIDATLLEAYIAPVDFEMEGEKVKKGSWVQAHRVDEDAWEEVESGELTGYSMAGTAIRIEDTDNE